ITNKGHKDEVTLAVVKRLERRKDERSARHERNCRVSFVWMVLPCLCCCGRGMSKGRSAEVETPFLLDYESCSLEIAKSWRICVLLSVGPGHRCGWSAASLSSGKCKGTRCPGQRGEAWQLVGARD